jgi:orotate phosphoribosyltransferase-like protein
MAGDGTSRWKHRLGEDETRNEKIIRLRNSGLTYAKIAQAVGVSREAVAGVIYRHADKPAAARLS